MEEKRFEIEIELPLVITEEDIDDIMSGALDSITYWCDDATPVGNYLGEYASEQIARGGELVLHDYEDGKYLRLNMKKLLDGIKMWIRKPVGYDCLVIEDGHVKVDTCNADAVVCDAIIQYALFGDVVYG